VIPHYFAKKRFGQNFLQDATIIHHILQTLAPNKKDNLIEIGPGFGALTIPLLKQVERLTAVEIDYDLIAYLKNHPDTATLHLIEQDVLKVDFTPLAESGPLRIIGNLPYHISTPILFHLLQYAPHIQDMHFMLQEEVVDRMTASAGNKTYGRLSVVLQYFCAVEKQFCVPNTAFKPEPKVTSAIVSLRPKITRILDTSLEPLFIEIVKTSFAQRRKTLRNNLKAWASDISWEGLDVDPTQRAEQLTVMEFVALTQHIHQNKE